MNNEVKSAIRLLAVLGLCSFVACVLTLIDLADWLFYFRPDWLALVVVYWVIALPKHVNLVYGFMNGLLLDVILVKPIGFHAIGFLFIAYFSAKGFSQIRVLVLWQQCLVVGLIIAFCKLIISFVAVMTIDFAFTIQFWYSTLGNMLFWPIIYGVLRYVRRYFLMGAKS